MKTARKLLTLSLVSFLASNALSAAPLADKLPEKTLFYVGWGGRTLTFDGSLLGQMLKEPEIGAIFGAARKAISAAISGNKDPAAAFEHLWSMGGIAWQHPVALATFDMSVRKRPAPRRGAEPFLESMFGQLVPVGAVLIDLGKDRPAFAEHLTKLLNLAGDKLKITRAKVGNVSYQTFPTPVGPCGLGFVGDLFFASVGEKAPQTIVALLGGKAKPLSAEAGFAAAMKQVAGEQVQAAYYLNVSRTYEIVDRAMADDGPATAPAGPSEFRRIVKALGVADVSAVAGAINIVDRGMHEKLRILSDAPHQGVLMLLAGKPLPANALHGAPADADLLLTVNLDPGKLLAEVKRVAAEIKPRAGLQIEEGLGMLSQVLGLDIEKDLLAHVGDQWMLVSAPSLGGFITGTVLTVELKDAAKFGESLSKLEAFFQKMLKGGPPQALPEGGPGPRRRGPEIRSCKVGKMEIRYLAMSGMPIPAAPAWAIANGRLYIAAFPQVIVAAVTGTAEKPLAADPAFVALRKRVAAAPSALAYANTPALVRRLYGVPMAIWSVVSNLSAGEIGPVFGAEMLPALPKLEKYLMADVCAVASDAKGITIESYGSGLGRGAVLNSPPLQALTVASLLPSLTRARGLAKRALSMTNLRGIGTGCEMYAVEHNEFPPDLMGLVEEGVITLEMFMSPTSGRKVRRDSQGKPIGPFDYVYLGSGLKPEDVPNPGRIILAYERPEINRFRGTNVVYVDTHAKWVSMERFNQELKQTRAFLEKHSKAGR